VEEGDAAAGANDLFVGGRKQTVGQTISGNNYKFNLMSQTNSFKIKAIVV
jgi:hypothetical protein